MRTPFLTIDVIILYEGGVVLIKRSNSPYKGCYALPGGFVEVGETVEEAAIREAHEETGLNIQLVRLVGVYSRPDRDPRGHTVSICFLARGSGTLRCGSDAARVDVLAMETVVSWPDGMLAFDHGCMIADALKKPNGIKL